MMEELEREDGSSLCRKNYTFIYKLFFKRTFMNLIKLFLLLLIFYLAFSVSSLDSKGFSKSDYFGTLEYLPPNITYSFYINNTSDNITFTGLNESNFHQSIQIPFDSSNNFNVKINYVWYHGWFDTAYLYLDEFVSTGVFYSSNSTVEISNGTYWSQFFLEDIPILNATNVTVNVTVNNNTGESNIELVEYGLRSSSNTILLNDTLVASHVYLPMLLETRFLQTNSNLELHLWIKDDFNGTSLEPHWTSVLHSVNEHAIQLVSPDDNLEIQTTSSEVQVDFTFFVNKSLFNPKDVPSCLIYIDGAGSKFKLKSTFDESSWLGHGSSVLSLGDYDWKVLCRDSIKSVQSVSNSFNIIQLIPTKDDKEEEEGGRRRITLPIQNLSLSSIQLERDSGKSAISFITGAVIGLFGEKGTFIIGLLLIIIGLASLVVYNREHLGLVKKDRKL